MKSRPKLQKGLYQLGKISVATNGDIFRSLDGFNRASSMLDGSASAYWRAQFWFKSVIRSFFALVEATSFTMRKAVVDAADEADLKLTNKERAKLTEKKYDVESDTITDIDVKGGKVADNLKLVFKYFPRIFDADFEPDLGKGWQDFRDLIKARNAMTHSGMLEHIIPITTLPLIQPSVMWFLRTLRDLLSACGLDKRNLPEQQSFVQPVSLPATPGLDESFYQMVRESESISLEYLRIVLNVLHREFEIPMQGLSETSAHAFLQDAGQFTVRNLLRTLFAQVEATTYIVNWYIEEQERREDIAPGLGLGEDDAQHGSRVADRLVKTFERFSRINGFDFHLQKSGPGWNSFLLAESFRDRITHPKDIGDLGFKMNQISRVLDAAGWFYESQEALSLSEKWAERQSARHETKSQHR